MPALRPIDLARIAYQAYGQTTDFRNYAGLPMPAFDDLGDKITDAWCAAVSAVEQALQPEAQSGTADVPAHGGPDPRP